jgi:hypothetical protein
MRIAVSRPLATLMGKKWPSHIFAVVVGWQQEQHNTAPVMVTAVYTSIDATLRLAMQTRTRSWVFAVVVEMSSTHHLNYAVEALIAPQKSDTKPRKLAGLRNIVISQYADLTAPAMQTRSLCQT